MNMLELLNKIYMLRLAPSSPDTTLGNKILKNELPFRTHEFEPDQEWNGWVVPKSWSVKKASIRKNGKLIYDGMAHPLGVIGYSQSFSGTISLEELQSHLFSDTSRPEAILYHCALYYRMMLKQWGFCIPHKLRERLENGKYEVELVTSFINAPMQVLDFTLPGETENTLVLNAHNCHAAQANDGTSGIVVGVELIKRLMQKKNRRLSYKLVIAPEHLGTVFYLSCLPDEEAANLKYCIFLEMLGSKGPFALQETFTGASLLDRASHHVLQHSFPDYFSDKFRKIVGNDETVWEAPGLEIPTISLSRFPYNEYHTNFDNHEIILESKLEEAVTAGLDVINILETNTYLKRRFKGLVALSNPKYDLYMHTRDPAATPNVTSTQKKWNYLMDCLPRWFDGKTSILDIAEKHDLPYRQVYDYLKRFEQKELVEFCPLEQAAFSASLPESN